MSIKAPVILILLSTIIIISYVYNLISRRTNIPSVLMLIGTGIGIKYAFDSYGFINADVSKLVRILGIAGLLMIVLEAALDLKIGRGKLKLIRNSFISALVIFLISAFGIAFLIMQWLSVPFVQSFIYAIPLSIISSAIVIPSTSHLPEEKKEFIIYESSFSDILGILLFNYMIITNTLTLGAVLGIGASIGIAILISVVASFLLIYVLSKITINIKFFLVFAVLALIYSLGELVHLPALLIVLIFGLFINNAVLVIKGPLHKWLSVSAIEGVVDAMKSITAETSFLIRTFFFILFGYTINIDVLAEADVWQLGSLIIIVLLVVRFVYLRVILKSNLFPELFLMPRGLVTILLFYSIPQTKSIAGFNEGVLFFVVGVSSILMMIGLLLFRNDKEEYLESNDGAI